MNLGQTQKLKVIEITEHGAVLEDKDNQTVLLPGHEAGSLNKNDEVTVFVYKDSEDRPVATLKKPLIELDELAPLKVKDITRIGAFLDWGLDKDLLLPFSEQTTKVKEGQAYLVKLYIDKSDRLAATMKVYPELKADSPYNEGDWVEGFVYEISPDLGAMVAVDNKYYGLVLNENINETVKPGRSAKLRVTKVRPDGKLMLSPVKKAYKEINTNAYKIIEALVDNQGFLPFNDKSSPEAIKAEFDISKGAFKKALGYLLKKGYIIQTEEGIKVSGK